MRLVGDIGGTNTRLALCDNGVIDLQTVRNFTNDQWPNLNNVISAFLTEHSVSLTDMAIAVAGPVHGGRARLTNRNWLIEKAGLIAMFDCDNVFLMSSRGTTAFAI